MQATVKWNVEYTAPLAGGQQLRVIGNVAEHMTKEETHRVFDEMDAHVMRLRERHEIPAMEEKQAQMEKSLEELKKQRDAQIALAQDYSERKRIPTNIQNAIDGLNIQIPMMEENLALIRQMIEERKVRTKSVVD